ncbi:MAG: pyruvate formate lyase family protein, partial [Clostridia bacterium]|nr:pyruvate formate lyase family protein [Clostridia bacterium]
MSEITFFSPMKEGRPVRLSQSTRVFAKESLAGTYGKEALNHKYALITLPEGTDPASITDRQKYDLAITAIAEQAPIRLMDGELISGSASLGGAIFHEVPATLDGEHAVCGSISHLTTNFYRVVSEGMDSFRARIEAKQKEPDLTSLQKEILSSQLNAWNAMKCWHTRYLEALNARMENADSADKKRLSAIYDNLTRVPFGPARTFREGVQSIWFTFSFQRLCGNWPGIGRMDLMLDDLYQADLAAGRITEGEARELLAHFFIKGCEWITLQFRGSGDAQHYQNLVLGGMDETGRVRPGDAARLLLE